MVNKLPDMVIGDGSLRVGDRVVYPNQGICKITGVSAQQIAGQSWEMVTLSREEDGATVMVPRAKVMGVGLRKIATARDIDEVFDELCAPSDGPQLDWKIRHRENADKMTGGGLFGTVEVLKGLHALTRIRPLPQKERELYDSARHLLVAEIAAATSVPAAVAEDNLDYALFPPPGMKRKGKELKPAVVPVSGTVRPVRTGEDGEEEEGLEEEAAVEEAAPAPRARALRAVEDLDEPLPEEEALAEEPAPAPKPKEEKPKEAKAPPAAHAPKAPAPAKEPAHKEPAHKEPAHKPAPKAAPKAAAKASKPHKEAPAKASKPAKAAPKAKPAAKAAPKKGKK